MKDLYTSFNDIEIDLDEIKAINVELDDVAKAKLKKNLKSAIKLKNHNKFRRIGLAAGICFMLLIGSLIILRYSYPAYAQNIHILNSIFRTVPHPLDDDFGDFSQVINQTKKDKGYEVRIDELVMDDYLLKLKYTIMCQDKTIKFYTINPNMTIKLNDENALKMNLRTFGQTNDHSIQMVEEYYIKDMTIPNNFTLSIDIGEIDNAIGNWNFKFNLSKKTIAKQIKSFNTNKEIVIKNSEGNDITLHFEKVSFSPISSVILINADTPFDYMYQLFEYFKFTFQYENGNQIKFNSLTPTDGWYPCLIGDSSNLKPTPSKTRLYSFYPMVEIPKNIIVEYKSRTSDKSQIIELPLANSSKSTGTSKLSH
jgi:hypothetical protein